MAFFTQSSELDGRPTTITHTFVVENECHGWRLDRFLCKKVPRLSRARMQRVIAGACTVDGLACKASQPVQPGQRVEYIRPAPPEPDAPRDFTILYADKWLYAIDKPAGLPMHPTAKFHYSTLTAVLREKFPGEALQLAHRLDRETSGIVLIARDKVTAAALKRAFARRQVHKRYLAIVHGALAGEGVIDQPLGLGGGFVRVKMAVREDGLPSRTRYRALESIGAQFTLVECFPETGRQHQIRAHLDWLGHPVVGDKLYPDENIFADYQDHGDEAVAHLLLPRHALHAASLVTKHPFSGEELKIESALPVDLAAFVAAQKQNAAA